MRLPRIVSFFENGAMESPPFTELWLSRSSASVAASVAAKILSKRTAEPRTITSARLLAVRTRCDGGGNEWTLGCRPSITGRGSSAPFRIYCSCTNRNRERQDGDGRCLVILRRADLHPQRSFGIAKRDSIGRSGRGYGRCMAFTKGTEPHPRRGFDANRTEALSADVRLRTVADTKAPMWSPEWTDFDGGRIRSCSDSGRPRTMKMITISTL
jgi:hypothetical protein